MNNSPVMQAILEAVADACSVILQYYTAELPLSAVSYKEDKSPVTQADVAAHQVLEKCLLSVADLPVLSEEAAVEDFSERSRWHAYWLVDPLDGTKEFIARTDEFTVNVALVVGGRSVLGVIAAPVTGRLYVGLSVEAQGERAVLTRLMPELNLGAYAVKTQISDWSDLHSKRGIEWSPTATTYPAQPITALTSRSHHGLEANQYLHRLEGVKAKPVGSSLKMCLIADGQADVYVRLGPTSEWDTAAAQAILEGAGGQLLDLVGEPLRYNQKASLLNPAFWASSEYFFVDTAEGVIKLKKCEFDANKHQ